MEQPRKRRPVKQFPSRGWTFITNHAQVLLAIARDPDLRVRQIADAAEITERYAYRLLRDLETAGYVHRVRRGRCNRYRLNPDLALGDPVVTEHSIRELLSLIGRGADATSSRRFLASRVRLDRSPRFGERSRSD